TDNPSLGETFGLVSRPRRKYYQLLCQSNFLVYANCVIEHHDTGRNQFISACRYRMGVASSGYSSAGFNWFLRKKRRQRNIGRGPGTDRHGPEYLFERQYLDSA